MVLFLFHADRPTDTSLGRKNAAAAANNTQEPLFTEKMKVGILLFRFQYICILSFDSLRSFISILIVFIEILSSSFSAALLHPLAA